MENLKNEIVSSDWQIARAAAEKLSSIGGQEVTDFLISLLESEIPGVRNVAALGLRDMGDSQAIEPLLKAIHKKQNENNRGTLVYALQTLDCSQKLPELFDLLFYGNYEVKMGVSVILDEQEFEFTREDLKQIIHKWQDLQTEQDVYLNLNEKGKKFIESYVEGFAVYLNANSD